MTAIPTRHIEILREQAERALQLATERPGPQRGRSRRARDPRVLREELDRLARNVLALAPGGPP